MSNRLMDHPWVFGKKLKIVSGYFLPDTAATPVVVSQGGGVSGVAHTDTGKFTITLVDPYHKCVGFQAMLATADDSTDLYAQAGAVANEGTSTPITAVVKLKTGSSNTDVAAAADTKVFFQLWFEDSSALGV